MIWRRSQRIAIIIFATVLDLYGALPILHAQGDWQYVGTSVEKEESQRVPEDNSLRPAARSKSGSDAELLACGEKARPASDSVRAIVEELERVSGASAQVYESVRPVGPHARAGGCILYSETQLRALFSNWFRLQEDDLLEPMLYAILAHELGHLAHDDFSPQRLQIDPVKRELEADRFAGYTLSRLNIRIDDLTDYYRLTGDDFTGIPHDHGTSAQRAEAFAQGWRRAELGLPEESAIGVGSPDHP